MGKAEGPELESETSEDLAAVQQQIPSVGCTSLLVLRVCERLKHTLEVDSKSQDPEPYIKVENSNACKNQGAQGNTSGVRWQMDGPVSCLEEAGSTQLHPIIAWGEWRLSVAGFSLL